MLLSPLITQRNFSARSAESRRGDMRGERGEHSPIHWTRLVLELQVITLPVKPGFHQRKWEAWAWAEPWTTTKSAENISSMSALMAKQVTHLLKPWLATGRAPGDMRECHCIWVPIVSARQKLGAFERTCGFTAPFTLLHCSSTPWAISLKDLLVLHTIWGETSPSSFPSAQHRDFAPLERLLRVQKSPGSQEFWHFVRCSLLRPPADSLCSVI